jgi:hypothetical protein
MKHNIITSIGLLTGAFILAQSKAIAQDQITKELLTRESGTWFSESTNAEGKKVNNYSYLYYIDELEKLRSIHLSVDTETKKLISTLHIFTGINKTGNQTEAIFFSSNGSVGKSTGIFNGNKNLIRFQGVNTNNIIFSGTLKKEVSDDGNTIHQTRLNYISNGKYIEASPAIERKKLDKSIMELFQEETILPSDNRNSPPFAKQFENLIGNWEMKNEDGDALNISWRMRGIGRILVENWAFFNEKGEQGAGGVNVTGIDPSSGRLTMWSIGKNGFARSGGWDFISDNVVGQRQGNNRLIRKLEDDNTITAYWQSKNNGEYTGENDKYTLKRVVGNE